MYVFSYLSHGVSGVKPDVIVTDKSRKLSQTTKSLDIPCVSQDWLVESIITGQFVDTDNFVISS